MPPLAPTLARIQHWDERVCVRLNRASVRPRLRGVLRATGGLGNGVFWYALMLAQLLARPDALRPVLHMIAVGLACTLVYKLLKRGTARPRPYQVHAHIAAAALPLDQFSFPSGHVLHAVGFSLVACSYYPWLAALLLPFTLLVAASRVVLGLHYPSDVIAGALLGAAIAGLSFNL